MNNEFINYSYYTSFTILIAGIVLFCRCNCLLYYLLILLGLTSIFNHCHNNTELDYNYSKWPIYRILDWTLVIVFFSYLYYFYYKEPIIYRFFIITGIIYLLIIWCNVFNFQYDSRRITHCITHLMLVFLIVYLYIYKNNIQK
jgi:hypothetical protein